MENLDTRPRHTIIKALRKGAMRLKGKGLQGVLLIVLASIAWSFAGVLSKWAPWGAYSLIGGRALVATLIYAAVRGGFKVRTSGATWLGALGVMTTSVLFIIANKMTTAANAIVLQYAAPIAVILLCWIFYGQRPGRVDIVAAVIAMAGVVLCFAGGLAAGSLLGDALALLSAFTFGLVFFAARMQGTSAMDYTYLGTLLCCGFLVFIPFDSQVVFTPQALLAVLAMGICLAVGYISFSKGMALGVPPVTAAIVANVEPVLNPLWVYQVIGETPGPFTLLGAVLVLLSVTLYSVLKGKQERKSPPEAAQP